METDLAARPCLELGVDPPCQLAASSYTLTESVIEPLKPIYHTFLGHGVSSSESDVGSKGADRPRTDNRQDARCMLNKKAHSDTSASANRQSSDQHAIISEKSDFVRNLLAAVSRREDG